MKVRIPNRGSPDRPDVDSITPFWGDLSAVVVG